MELEAKIRTVVFNSVSMQEVLVLIEFEANNGTIDAVYDYINEIWCITCALYDVNTFAEVS